MAIRKDVGYLLPEVIDPEAAVCIRVYVPDAPEYIAAFWGSYEFLTAWIAWEKDEAHRGKDAAAVWKPYYEQAREEYLCAEGSCGMFDVRQSPDDPCKLQKRAVCDGEWTEWADIALCKYGVTNPLYEEGESWKEIDDLLWEIKTLIEQIDSWLDDGKSADEIRLLLFPMISLLPGLTTVIDNLAGMSEGERTTAIAALDWDDIRLDVYCDGSECDPDYISDYAGWLNCISDWIFDTLNTTANDIFDGLNTASDWIYSALSLTPIAAAAGGGGSGFGGEEPECIVLWSHEFDFTVSDGGFVRYDGWGEQWQAGSYTSAGWGTEDKNPDTPRRMMEIAKTFADADLTRILITFDITWGNYTGGGNLWNFRIWNDGSYTQIGDVGGFVADGNGRTRDYDFTGNADMLELFASVSRDDYSGALTIKKLKVWGTGENPFD